MGKFFGGAEENGIAEYSNLIDRNESMGSDTLLYPLFSDNDRLGI